MAAQKTIARDVPREAPAHEAAQLPDLHDRVAEAYYGKMGDEFARSTRDRIHWICAHAEGTSVLDVGCSQGIAAILLGREGKKVVAIDVARRSVDEAIEYLAQESTQVQERVSFIHGDFRTYDFGDEVFDTVIVAEVLEHLTRPEIFVATAAERLRENGRLIVTVPFGVNDWPDHKRTFYLMEPWQLVSHQFTVEDVRLFGKWIGFTATKRPGRKQKDFVPPLDILVEAEVAFQKIERDLIERVSGLTRQLSESNTKLLAANEQKAALEKSATEREVARRSSEQGLQRLQSELDESRTLLEAIRAQAAARDTEAVRLAAELKTSERFAERLRLDAQSAGDTADRERNTRFEMQKAHLLSERRADELATRLQQTESRLSELEEEVAALNPQLSQARADEAKASQALAQAEEKLGTIQQQFQAAMEEKGGLQLRLSELEEEVAALKSQLSQVRADKAKASQEFAEAKEEARAVGHQLQDAINARAGLQSRVILLEQEKAVAIKEARRVKRSLSYKIGQAFKHGQGFKVLFQELWGRLKKGVRRRIDRWSGPAAPPAATPTPAPVTIPIQVTAPPAPVAVASLPAPVKVSPRPQPADLKSRPAKRARDFTVAFIADEFTFNSFRDEFKAVPIEPDDWRHKLEEAKPDIFFCESAWSGVDPKRRPWKGQIYASIKFPKENRTTLLEILTHCRKEGVPTVFWNKEDPEHYPDRVNDFVKTAREFDFVFTTAAECIEQYKREHGVANVFALPFATNPRLFNPVEVRQRSSNIVFAGSWYANLKERSDNMERILDCLHAQGFRLEIYDRYFGASDPNRKWPERYIPFIKPDLPHDRMPGVYKSSRFGLNFNTVTSSPTMFARRVFELMSCNTLVISNWARGVEEMFGDLVVFADRDLKRLKSLSEAEIDSLRERALTLVLREHTYAKRWRHILSTIGMRHHPEKDDITIACMIRDRDDALAAIAWYQQRGRMLNGAQLLLIVDGHVADLEVAQLYQQFNRFGIGVTSVSHATKYALEGHYRPIETSHFALIDPLKPPPLDWIEKAILHLQYMTEHAIAPAEAVSERYGIAAARPGQPLIGLASLFPQLIQSGAANGDVYRI